MIYFIGHLTNARNEMTIDPETGKRKLTPAAVAARKVQKEMYKRMLAGEVELKQRRIGEDIYEYHAILLNPEPPPSPVALPFITDAQLRARR